MRIGRGHVCVVGIGGVGSWTVEALARSGVGEVTLVDLDDVCLSNVNRQIHALDSTVGRFKVDVMAERMRDIHPAIRINAVRKYLTEENASQLLCDQNFDVVVDAIDNGRLKCVLLEVCRKQETATVTVGGAGGLRDPARVRRADLAKSHSDPLLHQVRKRLRQQYDWPRGERDFGVACVFSEEQPVILSGDAESDPDAGAVTVRRAINCNTGLGTSAAVTGAFGLAAAAAVLDLLADPETTRTGGSR
jgi:tRNA A37 threonylcarbamoyladenosine dehydratase